ncbi:ensconsin-like isoform X2 [Tigriopus californicus]|uniref:ensconsin-like isoform X2 n=1 Tax=Tigriopus californicus TaxID=6832 RepID=UPI0027DA05C3|nr:ensconsin-like isoform X2 [Tigriopus californicus]XP_059096349.1 ensconsin-like isoform X2 [Tigriopus californicus]
MMNTSVPQSRAQSGVSRLALVQARFQAQQLAQKEEKLIHLLEQRQEETVRRINNFNGRDSIASHSANSLSSNNSANSITPSVGQRPGRVRQMFEDRRKNEINTTNGTNGSPVGWDKSYPLKPVNGALYKRNSNAALNVKSNKYSGNYGPRRSSSQNRGVSLDRARYAASNSSGYSSASMARTRSHHQLSQSSGEDSYGSTSRPPSRGGMGTYGTYGARGRMQRSQTGYEDDYDEIEPKKTSYTREYIKNLPPTNSTPRGRMARPNRLREPSPAGRASFEHNSYSSQSSEKSDPPAFTVLHTSKSAHQLGLNGTAGYNGVLASSSTEDNVEYGGDRRSTSRPRIDTRTFRKSRSPEPTSRSPSLSPTVPRSKSMQRRRSSLSRSEAPPDHSAYLAHQERTEVERRIAKEREEEKRRMQVEMRRREQELLERIKRQQKELETMKQEKTKAAAKMESIGPAKPPNFQRNPSQRSFRVKQSSGPAQPVKPTENKQKVERELQRQEANRERDRKLAEDKRREEERVEERERMRERERVRRDRMTAAREQATAKRQQHQLLSRTSSVGTNGSSGHSGTNNDSDEDFDPATYNVTSPTKRSSPLKSVNGGYRTTININADNDDSRHREIHQSNGGGGGGGTMRSNSHGGGPARTVSKKTKPSISSSTPGPASSTTPSGPKERKSLFASNTRDDLVPCSNCGRSFADDRIAKHEEICTKTSKKKRKTFDSTKKRVAGTEAEVYVKRASKSKKQEKPVKKADWRKKREEFINALRAAKEAQRYVAAGGKISDLPPPPPMDTSDYIQCPHCGRKFNEAAADRHIPKCKDIKSNKR